MAGELTFAACTFTRVFDTEPLQDALTLPELTRALTRFELKPKVLELIERDIRRAQTAWAAWQAGTPSQGKNWSALERAAKAASAAGGDPESAARAAFEKLVDDAHKRTKREIRLWSPALYTPGARRESEQVVHLSCLVLDYDGGPGVDEVSAAWSPWFHILHTTWSHTPERPKLRVALPLLNPVLPEDWYGVYDWALDRLEGGDPTGKSIGSTFALPVVPNRGWPRAARVSRAPLLDPLAEGLVTRSAPLVEVPRLPLEASFLRGQDPEHEFIPPEASLTAEEPEADFDLWGEVEVEAPPVQAPPSEPAPALDPLLARLDALLERLEVAADHGFVGALERLMALYDAGGLSDDEYQVAKERLLRG